MFRIYRKRAGLSQKALAEKAGLIPSRVSRIEGGKVRPLFDTVNALAAAMGAGAHRWVADEQEYTRLMTEDDPWEFVPEWILELG